LIAPFDGVDTGHFPIGGVKTKTPARSAPAGVLKIGGWLPLAYLFLALDGARGTTTLTTRTVGTTRRETNAIAATKHGETMYAAKSGKDICRSRDRKKTNERIRNELGRKNKCFFTGRAIAFDYWR
jgi:hypothetical protein